MIIANKIAKKFGIVIKNVILCNNMPASDDSIARATKTSTKKSTDFSVLLSFYCRNYATFIALRTFLGISFETIWRILSAVQSYLSAIFSAVSSSQSIP